MKLVSSVEKIIYIAIGVAGFILLWLAGGYKLAIGVFMAGWNHNLEYHIKD